MKQSLIFIGNIVELRGKKYLVVEERQIGTCKGCAFEGDKPCPVHGGYCLNEGSILKELSN